MTENNREQFVRDYKDAEYKYLAVIDKCEYIIKVLDRYLKRKSDVEIVRYYNRIKDVDEVIKKAEEKKLDLDLSEVEQRIHDIVGFRIVTNYIYEIYEIAETLTKIPGFNVIKTKDYIVKMKESTYRSLHLVAMIEVYTGESSQVLPVEVQICDVMMEAWSTLEHREKYKRKNVSERLSESFIRQGKEMKAFDEEINAHALAERQRNLESGTMCNTARVSANEPIIEQKVES